MPAPQRIIIASRESRLALWQSGHVRAQLLRLYPQCKVEILGMKTQGDRILDVSLSKIGGKGLFVKELEAALAEGRADIAVHSAKDVPMVLPDGFMLAAIGPREDARDCLVSAGAASLADLPAGSVVGTSSLRREAQIRERFPQLQIAALRGNVDTRLAKLDRGEYAAIVLAAAGLKRLGLEQRVRALLPLDESLPAPGQGALAIECRAGRSDLAGWLAPLHDAATAACVQAERALSRSLSGSCQLPLAAYAECRDGRLNLRGLVAQPDGRRVLRARAEGPQSAPEPLGAEVARQLRQQGADGIIAALAP
jgi:hydroxymethylbilane synthase